MVTGLLDDEVSDLRRALQDAATHARERGTDSPEWNVHAYEFDSAGLTSLRENSDNADAVLFVPRLPTWSRLPALNRRGPRPLRSRRFIWGHPWARGLHSSRLDEENTKLRMVLDCMASWLEAKRVKAQHSKAWLGFVSPEDLGRTREHEPASPWQLRELRELAK
jgi:hypothetical protein